MMKRFKSFSWLFVMMLQIFLGIGVGFFALSFMKVQTVAESTHVGALSLGGMSLEEARKAVEPYLKDKIKAGVLTLEVDKTTYKIPYSDLDVAVDLDKTLENLKASMPSSGLGELFMNSGKDLAIAPVIRLNSGKLLAQCETIFKPLEKESVPEYYEIQGDVLRFVPQVPGVKVDYPRLEEELKQVIAAFGTEPYRVDTLAAEGSVFIHIADPSRYEETFSALISKCSIPIDSSLEALASEALESVYGRVFKKGETISLAELVAFDGFSTEVERDLLNRIATALYQSGISIDGMEILSRKQSSHAVPYSEPGLEAIIEGVGANLALKNETDRTVMLLHEISQGTLSFYWISTGELRSGILITQKKDEVPPSIITTVNRDLSKGQTRVISEGIPGYTVYVSRIIDDERVELYSDKYQPVSKMVEIGEGTLNSSAK